MTQAGNPLESGWTLLEEGDAEGALDRAEAFLAVHPGDVEALHLAGCALMQMDALAEAEAHLREAVRIDPEWSVPRESLAMVLYQACRFEPALAEIDRVVAQEPLEGTPLYLKAQILDLMGRLEEADACYEGAARLDPDRCPRPVAIGREAFDAVVEEALEALPPAFRDPLGNVPILVEEVPTPAILETLDLPSPDLLGLFVGVPVTDQSTADRPTSPNTIYLFKRNLERLGSDPATLVEEIRITLLHEIGHYLGLEEDDLDEAGYA